ncbi:hypothetical protein TVAG_466670 [Trichomonas vaginalis G3]|uniref:Uncharacterized protein n=1 Tax=Trichomonas vaginalis (strain ATCC PRA-98 / G3) TaxID=412133 RepID=A2FL93_TRIV3|nr:V-type ATPase assembly factor PKR1 family [Trichomonas vaginalis G3]EAX94309.1 hypothetical protein TVAG_466670 [Trichomonas vaginalis G3]KAI5533519.1 V-type ATPase assembly factor PKR1 family [Trichomonas vaginalis G3]|eukprot:XP_001307239.1 hypothetical protein [Trichomonas vaginalis G3]
MTEQEKPQTQTQTQTPYSQMSWIEKLLTPGIGDGIIMALRFCFFLLMVFLLITVFLTYNIHFVIMSILSLCLFLSFEYLIANLKKYDLLNPEESKEKKEQEEKEKEEKKDENKEKQD